MSESSVAVASPNQNEPRSKDDHGERTKCRDMRWPDDGNREECSSDESAKNSLVFVTVPKPNISSGIHRLYRGLKSLSQLFVYKEDMKEDEAEIEIGDPTDVKHVTHIVWDGCGTASKGAPGIATRRIFSPETFLSLPRYGMQLAFLLFFPYGANLEIRLISSPPPPEETATAMEEVDDVADKPPPHNPRISVDPVDWFIKLAFLQAELIYTCMNSILSPVFTIFAVALESYRHAEEVRENVGSAVQKVPSAVACSSVLLVKRLGLGIVAAAYLCMVLSVLMALSVVIGVSLVEMSVEEPVFLKEKLHFDYTEIHPKAVLSFRGSGSGQGFSIQGSSFIRRKHAGIPAGHTFVISVVLEMPESDYNRQVGVFQLTAELLSANGRVITRSSQPLMLRYRSLPIRLTRTFLLGLPLLLGVSVETQKIKIEVLSHREGHPRSEAIGIGLIPRAGTISLPQVIDAEIAISSQLPWTKELLYNWKWTFYVWSSLYTYTLLLLVLLCCCRWLVLPQVAQPREEEKRVTRDEEEKGYGEGREGEMEELIRRWEQRRRKRKANLMSESGGGGAESSVVTTQHSDNLSTEDVGDSESVCLG